jgi:competence protein ComEC
LPRRTPSHEYSFVPYPLALLAAAFSAGILIAHFFPIPLAVLLCFAAGASVLSLCLLHKRNAAWATLPIILATLLAGAALDTIEKRSAPESQIKRLFESGLIAAGDPVELTGVLKQPPEYTPDGFYLTIRAEKLRLRNIERPASGVVQLLAPVGDDSVRAEYEKLELRYGARVRVMAALDRPDNYRNPGVSSFTEFLDRKGYDATGKLKSPLLVERLDDGRVFVPLLWLYEWRQVLEREIKKHFSAETAGVLDAALLGNRYHLSHQAAERFREGGTFHVLVISGLHISFIGGLVLLIARRLTRKRGLQFVLSAVVLWSYTVAVGAESSVVRSALMFTLVALAPVVSRRANSLNALGGAGLLLLLWKPRDLFDPSFQLTFLSVLAIVVIAAPLLHKLSLIGQWQPAREAPYPPAGPAWLRKFCEALYWRERRWRKEMANSNYRYQLFKSPLALRFERYRVQWLLRYSVGALIVSISVQVGLLPLLILYFHRLSLSSLVLNIFVSVLMALLGIVALAALALVHISVLLAAPLVALANALSWLMVHSVDLFTHLGMASLRLPEYAGWPAALYVLYYLPLALLVGSLARWHPLSPTFIFPGNRRVGRTAIAAVLQLVLLSLLVAHPLSAGRADGKLRIDFLDVGQGDAALVTMPDGTTLLIDGGGRPSFRGRNANSVNDPGAASADEESEQPFERDTRSIGEAVVSEYLWGRGLDRVDYVMATHADADHMDGLSDVARNFQVRAAFVARTPGNDPEYAKFAETLRARQIPVSVLAAGDVLHFGGVTATALWPPPVADNNAPSRNNDSIVLRLQFGARTILMTGDVEKEGEAAILGGNNNLSSDVVKVPHHGSKTSSTEAFVTATHSPHSQLAIISVGLTSMFGHPTKEVVDRWRASGAEVMTTGKRGTITIFTDGEDLRVETFIQ